MNKKNIKPEVAQNENENVVVNPELEKAKIEAAKLAEAAKEAARVAKEAAKAAKEAAEKAKAMNSRPIRLARFQAELDGDVISKTDVHYCAEKAAIDYVAELRANGGYENQIIEIWKRYKSEDQQDMDVCLSKVYIDASTNQIVID